MTIHCNGDFVNKNPFFRGGENFNKKSGNRLEIQKVAIMVFGGAEICKIKNLAKRSAVRATT
jgi:hypothetical protein